MNDAKMLRNVISGMNDRPVDNDKIYQDLINGFVFYSREPGINVNHKYL